MGKKKRKKKMARVAQPKEIMRSLPAVRYSRSTAEVKARFCKDKLIPYADKTHILRTDMEGPWITTYCGKAIHITELRTLAEEDLPFCAWCEKISGKSPPQSMTQ